MSKNALQITYGLVISFYLSIFFSCTSYHKKVIEYQILLQNNNFEQAYKTIARNKFLKKNKNKLLYLLEKGKLAHLNNDYQTSNQLLNSADNIIEANKRNIGRQLLGVVTNPENKPYRGEDFEKVAIHYYKSLNYTFLEQYDDALVEAKRINLQLQQINEKYPDKKKNRYINDAFALNLQGLIYEAADNINDAFIAYRNAVDLYLKENGTYFNVPVPKQLIIDLIRTADIMGFTDDKLKYEEIFDIKYTSRKESLGGEVIIFWENGLIPYKSQTYYTFSMLPGDDNNVFSIFNEELNIVLPIPVDLKNDNGFSEIDVFNVAFPKYIQRQPYFTNSTIQVNANKSYPFQLVQDYNAIAFKTLKDRTFREIGEVALRLAVKKLSEYVVKDQNEDIGAILGIFNALTEKADTRNWQTLPGYILYARIPLEEGDNVIEIEFQGANMNTVVEQYNIKGNGKIQFVSVATLQTLNI